MNSRISNLVDQITETCIPWIKEKNGSIQFIDPLDDMEISAHYGASHAAAALIIYGIESDNHFLVEQGEKLLFSVLDRWNTIKNLPGFHNDFNNFALCVLDAYTKKYHDKIAKTVLSTTDSNHDTVNWLPMRWYVNKCRYEWSGDLKYLSNCKNCAEKIEAATFSDGFIDDRLPIGTSFNLQYDVATVAVLQFLRISGEKLDISKETGALLNAVCPDGDINYLGRGTNQIFAWGLWIYLLASSSQTELNKALSYLEERLPVMLANQNLMLNDFPGKEKYMWWDYHYCSVYTSHLLFWLVLAWKDEGKKPITSRLVEDGSSGVHIYKNKDVFVSVFDGRTEYLAEHGPVVAAIWTKKSGIVCKGTFGPWYGPFGNKYTQPDVGMRNFTGLLKVNTGIDWSKSRILRKLFPNGNNKARETVEHIFSEIDVRLGDRRALIIMKSRCRNFVVNISEYEGHPSSVLLIDGKKIPLINAMKIRNQYGWINILQSGAQQGSEIRIEVE